MLLQYLLVEVFILYLVQQYLWLDTGTQYCITLLTTVITMQTFLINRAHACQPRMPRFLLYEMLSRSQDS